MFTPLITHDSDGTALAAPVDAARRNGATYKTRTIDDLRIKDDRLRAAIEGTGHLLFDGGMGTMLQAAGMKAGALPELLNFEEPQVITDIQRQYVKAGCDVITSNTFGANAHKLDGAATVADVFAAAVTCAREAGARYVAGDIGPIGALLRPWAPSALTRPTTFCRGGARRRRRGCGPLYYRNHDRSCRDQGGSPRLPRELRLARLCHHDL